MNRHEHFGFSLILFGVVAFVMYLINAIDYLVYAIGIFVGGALPDILEPAMDWNHRAMFHSVDMLHLLYWSLPFTLVLGLFFNWILFVFFLAIGYIGHLWLDSTTPMGLPRL